MYRSRSRPHDPDQVPLALQLRDLQGYDAQRLRIKGQILQFGVDLGTLALHCQEPAPPLTEQRSGQAKDGAQGGKGPGGDSVEAKRGAIGVGPVLHHLDIGQPEFGQRLLHRHGIRCEVEVLWQDLREI